MSIKSPSQTIESHEFDHAFLTFCTFVSLLHGKKMNYPTVFLKILENKRLREIYMNLINEEST